MIPQIIAEIKQQLPLLRHKLNYLELKDRSIKMEYDLKTGVMFVLDSNILNHTELSAEIKRIKSIDYVDDVLILILTSGCELGTHLDNEEIDGNRVVVSLKIPDGPTRLQIKEDTIDLDYDKFVFFDAAIIEHNACNQSDEDWIILVVKINKQINIKRDYLILN